MLCYCILWGHCHHHLWEKSKEREQRWKQSWRTYQIPLSTDTHSVKILSEIRHSYLRVVLKSSSGATYINVRTCQEDVFSLTVKDEWGFHLNIQLWERGVILSEERNSCWGGTDHTWHVWKRVKAGRFTSIKVEFQRRDLSSIAVPSTACRGHLSTTHLMFLSQD